MPQTTQRVLFVCVHNAGRSQMAEAIFNARCRETENTSFAESAGTLGSGSLNPVVVEVVAELGIPMDGHVPKLLTPEMVARADRIISMGCGVDTEACPTRFLITDDWGLDDPAGQSIETVRKIRDEIVTHVNALIAEISK